MKKYKILAIDESGKASYKHKSPLFILTGVIIPENYKSKLDGKIRKIKRKYFNDEDIVFHGRDMARKKGPFSILKDSKKELCFWGEFISILNDKNIQLCFIITDKNKAKKKGWQPKTILKRSYLSLLQYFVGNILAESYCGRIIAESDPYQDLYLIQAHNTMQFLGMNNNISPFKYKNTVTSISFVGKNNQDIDIQIADALTPIAGFLFMNKKMTKDKVVLMKERLIKRKLKEKSKISPLKI